MPPTMGIPTFVVEVFGDKQVERQLLRMGERVADPVPLWESLAEDLLQIEGKQFSSEGASGSGGWAPLADSTLRRKLAKGFPAAILQATQALMDSLTRRGAAGQILDITPEGMRFGTDVAYGGFHQRGTSKMPQRRILEFTEMERVALIKKVQLFVVRGVVGPL